MAIGRQTYYGGPAALKFGGAHVLHSKDGITVDIDRALEDLVADVAGRYNQRQTDQTAKLAITPAGALTADLMALMFPWGTPAYGAGICAADDVACLLHAVDGTKRTFHNVVCTKPPELYLRRSGDVLGSAEFTALCAKGKLPTATGGFLTDATATYDLGVPGTPNLEGKVYAAALGPTEGQVLYESTDAGFTVNVVPTLEARKADGCGTVDFRLTDLKVTVKFKPYGMSVAEALALTPLGGPGSFNNTAKDLVISATGGLVVTLKNVSVDAIPQNFTKGKDRTEELMFTANPDANGLVYSIAFPT